MYDCDPGHFLVILVICHCVTTMEATMETARLIEEDGREVNTSVGCKAEGLFVSVDSRHYAYTHPHKCGQLLLSRKTVPAWYRLMVHRRREDWVGTPSEALTMLQYP